MERLPYIDTHMETVEAGATKTWEALLSVLRGSLAKGPPAALAGAMRLDPPIAHGDWSAGLKAGDSLPGFEVEDVLVAERLALTGRHRFSRYALVFELEAEAGGARSLLRAQTHAAFPGTLGKVYRMMVIGTRAHRLVVRRLLRRVAERV